MYTVQYGDFINQNEALPALSRILLDILEHEHIQWHPSLIRHCTYSWPTLYRTGPCYRIMPFFQVTFATVAACKRRTLTPLDTWTCPIRIYICPNVEASLFEFQINSVLLFYLWEIKTSSQALVRAYVHPFPDKGYVGRRFMICSNVKAFSPELTICLRTLDIEHPSVLL